MEAAKETSGGSGAHPDLEELIEYHQGSLRADLAEAIQEHLVLCRKCTAMLLDLQAFSEAESTPPSLQDDVPARLLTRVISFQVRAERWRNTALLAASLLLATTVPLGLYYRPQGQENAPEINLPTVSLLPRSSMRGDQTYRLELPPGAKWFSLLLTTTEPPSASEHVLVFSGASGHEVRLSGLHPTPEGTFSIGLTPTLVPPGHYSLKLQAVKAGSMSPLDDYRLDIVLLPGRDSKNASPH